MLLKRITWMEFICGGNVCIPILTTDNTMRFLHQSQMEHFVGSCPFTGERQLHSPSLWYEQFTVFSYLNKPCSGAQANQLHTYVIVCRIRNFDLIFRMNFHTESTSSLLLKSTGALYTCFIPIEKLQYCISIALELEREPGTNDRESSALAGTLAGLIPNGSSIINTTCYSALIRH